MALRSVSLLLLVVVGLAHETAPSKPDATAAVGPANETSSTWSNFVYCKCGLTCVKQMGSWYIFDLGQSCACQACPEEPADATGHLRGSQETAPKEIPSQENHETEPKPAEKPDAAEHTKDTEGTETKLSLKSLKIAPSTENEGETRLLYTYRVQTLRGYRLSLPDGTNYGYTNVTRTHPNCRDDDKNCGLFKRTLWNGDVLSQDV